MTPWTVDDETDADRLTPSAPARIWLQIYVRCDLVLAVLPVNWQDDPDWVRLARCWASGSQEGMRGWLHVR